MIGFHVSRQDETVVDMAILDLRIADKSSDDQEVPLLFLTKARSMVRTILISLKDAALTTNSDLRACPHDPSSVRLSHRQ